MEQRVENGERGRESEREREKREIRLKQRE